MQKQPRPPIIENRTGRYITTTWIGGLPSYNRYTVETFLSQLDFPRYAVSPKGVNHKDVWNNLDGYSKLQRVNLPSVIPVGHSLNPNTKLHYAIQPQIPSGRAASVRDIAFQKVNMKLHSEIQEGKNQLLMAFAERQKTIDMVSTRVIQAYHIVRALKRGNVRKAWRTIKGRRIPRSKKAASLQLEVYYGWMQLTKEIYTLAKQPGPIQDVSLRVPMSQRDEGTVSVGIKGDYENPPGSTSWNIKVSYILKADIELNEPLLASASQLGLTNPAYVAWDLFPPSLWVDWFLPIGSYLEQFETFKGLRVLRHQHCETVRKNAYYRDVHGAERSFQQKTKRRFNGTLSYKLRMKNPLSFIHAANAIALIRTKFR